jgi:site-specific DNA recombinase
MASIDIVCPTKIAAYIRWSTDDQSDGTTLEVQRESCMHYIKAQGWEFRDDLTFIDDGYSGGSLDRPAMRQLRQAVAEGRIACVVVYKLDRLSRSVLDTVNLVLEEWEGKCHVKSTREPIDTTSPSGKMFFYMLVSYAEWERSVIRERTLSGKKKRAEQGKNPGMVLPYGLVKGAKPGDVVEDEAQGAVVRRIFRDYAGGKGLLTIAEELNREGAPTKAGTPWRASSILYMLKNEAYKGVLIYGTRVETKSRKTGKREIKFLDAPRHARVEGAWPVVVDHQLWETVQGVLKARALAPKRSLSATYLLSGIAKCRCGAPLVGNLVDSRYRTYYCASRRNHGPSACPAQSINADDVEHEIVQAVRAHYTEDSEEGFVVAALSEMVAERDAAAAVLGQLEAKVQELSRRLHRLHADYDAGELSGRLYNARVEEIESELDQANGDLAAAQMRLAEVVSRMRSVESIRAQFRTMATRADGWEQLSSEEQKQVLRHAIEVLTLWCSGKDRDPVDRRRLRQVIEVDMTLRKPAV